MLNETSSLLDQDDAEDLVLDRPKGKLTDWENEPTAMDLDRDFMAAKPAHDALMVRVRKWNDIAKASGQYRPKEVKGRSKVQPKLVRRQAEWRYSALTEPFNSSSKMFSASPRTFEDEEAARQNELVLNWQWDTKLNRVHFIDQYVRSCVDDGTAIVFPGWRRITKKVMVDAPVWEYALPTDQAYVQMFDQANQQRQADPRGFEAQAPAELVQALKYWDETGQVTEARQTGVEQVEQEQVVDNRPTLCLLDPDNWYPDPSCGDDYEEARFGIRTFETSKAELMLEPDKYKNLDQVNWDNASPLSDPDHASQSRDTNFNFADPLRKRIVAKEYWGLWDAHKTGELVPIVATWIGQVVIRCDLNPYPDQTPVPAILVPYMPLKRDSFGEPDAELLEDNQQILGAVTRGAIDLMGRSANAQLGTAKNWLDPLNKRRFDNGQDFEFNPGVPVEAGMVQLKFPEIPQSVMLMLNLQNQEAEALTGVKAFAGGISGNAYGDVAANARSALDAASKREMAILRRLASGLVKVGRRMAAMNAAFMSEEEVIRVTNAKFVTVKREDLAGDFDLKIDIATPEIDQAKAQDLAFMLQTMGNTMSIEITLLILAEIADLKRMPELAQKIRTFQPKPDPIAQQKAQLEVEKLKMELEELKSRIALNNAKAQEVTVKADQIDLDRVEQEKGVTHARRMAEMGAQADGNQDAEITKALVKPKKKDEKDPDIEAAVGWNEVSRRRRDDGTGSPAPQPVPVPVPVTPGDVPVNPVETMPAGVLS